MSHEFSPGDDCLCVVCGTDHEWTIDCPCGDSGCFCDCVSDWVDCVCETRPGPFTEDEVLEFRKAQEARRAAL
jgi:hypothetical protein